MRLICLTIAIASLSCAQTADEIMARVATNQDASSAARAKYVYHQNLLVRMKRAMDGWPAKRFGITPLLPPKRAQSASW